MIRRTILWRDVFRKTVQACKASRAEAPVCRNSESRDNIQSTTQNQPVIAFSDKVLDAFREDVGKYYPETGGMLASSKDGELIDRCYFDMHSKNTPGRFYYDVETMSEVYRSWKAKGYVTNGIYHSHPAGAIRPSYHDISTALLHLDFFKLDYFYLPIFQPKRNGQYSMYFYVVRRKGNQLEVKLEYILRAEPVGYSYEQGKEWEMSYSIQKLREYRKTIDNPKETQRQPAAGSDAVKSPIDDKDYFGKVRTLYPEKVLDKVIVCIGTGGARSFLENMARGGFKNFVLMDADIVSPSNIATQGVYISEMGKKKVEVIRDHILDINPDAKVICVDRFLDDQLSDEEFKGFLDSFPDREPKDYLILGCTDNFDAQKRSSFLALKYGMPYLAAMMYEGGAASELIFVYPDVTESCPRCLLRDRFEKYENGFVNDVDSSACPIFATERMNALKGYIALMLLMYKEAPGSMFNTMLDEVKDRNFVEIRMNPHLKDSKLGIGLFDRVLESASRYTYMDETLWIPQHPDRPEFGEKPCLLCGGKGDLRILQEKWKDTDTRAICIGLTEKEKLEENSANVEIAEAKAEVKSESGNDAVTETMPEETAKVKIVNAAVKSGITTGDSDELPKASGFCGSELSADIKEA